MQIALTLRQPPPPAGFARVGMNANCHAVGVTQLRSVTPPVRSDLGIRGDAIAREVHHPQPVGRPGFSLNRGFTIPAERRLRIVRDQAAEVVSRANLRSEEAATQDSGDGRDKGNAKAKEGTGHTQARLAKPKSKAISFKK